MIIKIYTEILFKNDFNFNILTNFFSVFVFISLARVWKASSTLTLVLAEVSINLIPYSTANCSPRSFETYKKPC